MDPQTKHYWLNMAQILLVATVVITLGAIFFPYDVPGILFIIGFFSFLYAAHRISTDISSLH